MGDAPIRLVCFDWGGVLLRICRDFREGCAAAGLEFRDGAATDELYDVRHSLAADYQVGKLTEEEFFGAVSQSFRGLYSPAEIALIHDAWLVGEYPGVADLVASLHATPGIATGMLSNTNARHWARRERDFPTAGTLHHQHASHLLGAAKPDPFIFRAFERETAHAPAEILFFDDLPANIDAARSAGWNAVAIDHAGDTAAQMRAALRDAGVLA